ncbi:MAG: HAD hydrolase-like protein [Syntrophobacterales bacterium]|jgi:phosphoglycolate phosphatase|nr:HAD hydrolase-like protein [Syntrophobacterales bacterium]
MSRYVDLMLFDFDGTLADTGGDLARSVNYTLRMMELPEIAPDVILTFVGDGVGKLIERALGGAGDEQRKNEALEIFSRHYEKHLLDSTVLYPGVLETLNHFRGKRKIILTNKRLCFTEKICDGLQILDYFIDIIAGDSTPFIKPAPQLLDVIRKHHYLRRDQTVIIGDGVNDLRLAKNTGILCACHLNGLGNRDDLQALQPDMTFGHFAELKDLLA